MFRIVYPFHSHFKVGKKSCYKLTWENWILLLPSPRRANIEGRHLWEVIDWRLVDRKVNGFITKNKEKLRWVYFQHEIVILMQFQVNHINNQFGNITRNCQVLMQRNSSRIHPARRKEFNRNKERNSSLLDACIVSFCSTGYAGQHKARHYCTKCAGVPSYCAWSTLRVERMGGVCVHKIGSLRLWE